MSDKLTVLTSTTYSKAQIITSRLESVGIECFLKNVNLVQPSVGSGIKIYVREDDLERAYNLIDELHKEFAGGKNEQHDETSFPDLFLVPVDFSPSSLNACFYAIELAHRFKARLKIIHVYGLPEIRPMSFDDTDFYQGTLALHLSELREEAEQKMKDLEGKIRDYIQSKKIGDLPIAVTSINGLPDEIITYTAQTEKAGLVIIGVSKKDVRSFEPMGKMASQIIEKVTMPVLVIPENASFKNLPRPQNILYATDFDESDFPAIKRLIRMVQRLNSNIHCVHISKMDGNPWDNIKMEGLREYFSKAYDKANVSCELIIENDILKALDDYIKNRSVDILSVTYHKRNFIWKLINPSLTLKILYHTEVPLLVFHG